MSGLLISSAGSWNFFLPIGAYSFLIQLIVAEGIFLYGYEKRRFFWLRLFVSLAICFVYLPLFYFFFPYGTDYGDGLQGKLQKEGVSFLLFCTQIAVTVLGAKICFKEKIWTIVSACMFGYAVQHFAFNFERLVGLFVPMYKLDKTVYNILIFAVFYAPIYIVAWYLFGRENARREYKNYNDKKINALSLGFILMAILSRRVSAFAGTTEIIWEVINKINAMIFCLGGLMIQFFLHRMIALKTENLMLFNLRHEGERQYEQWKASLDEMNMCYHDLRHEMIFMKETGNEEQYQKLAKTLEGYASAVHTGMEVLDVLITGKRMICNKEKINFSCVADARGLRGFDQMELYVLLGNALDNAIEALKKVEKIENRVMCMIIRSKAGMVEIVLENYFSGQITWKDGLPVTDQTEEWHGYGMKSMKRIVKKNGGVMSVSVEGNMFYLSILLPVMRQEGEGAEGDPFPAG